MTDDLIDRLASDLHPMPPRTLERRLLVALAAGFAIAAFGVWLILGVILGRPFGGADTAPMFWSKFGYTLAFGLLGVAAVPALARPDGRILWPLVAAAILALFALGAGSMQWMRADFPMPMLMGTTALICPLLILLAAAPMLATLLATLRQLAPRSPTQAGLAAGLLAGGLGAWAYAFYCGETGMMFMAVWYSLGIALSASFGALLGRRLLRW